MPESTRENPSRKPRRAASRDLQYYASVVPNGEEQNKDRPDFLWRLHTTAERK